MNSKQAAQPELGGLVAMENESPELQKRN